MRMAIYGRQDNPMDFDDIAKLVSRGKEQYRFLMAEAEALLRNIEICGPEVYEGTIIRRQECIAELHEIDASLVGCLNDMGGDPDMKTRQALDEFRAFRETAIRTILEFDSLVIALVGDRLVHLKDELVALGRGKTALTGYESSGRAFRRNLNDTA